MEKYDDFAKWASLECHWRRLGAKASGRISREENGGIFRAVEDTNTHLWASPQGQIICIVENDIGEVINGWNRTKP